MITVFMRSLTEHWDGKLIAVIVSGFDGDGVAALSGKRKVDWDGWHGGHDGRGGMMAVEVGPGRKI